MYYCQYLKQYIVKWTKPFQSHSQWKELKKERKVLIFLYKGLLETKLIFCNDVFVLANSLLSGAINCNFSRIRPCVSVDFIAAMLLFWCISRVGCIAWTCVFIIFIDAISAINLDYCWFQLLVSNSRAFVAVLLLVLHQVTWYMAATSFRFSILNGAT